ncbi:MAG TPA: hypothetical protein PK718_02760 [Candidatus Methanofastidiosa archaeon]|nr:hypothetical protein [Candidatus Methanofastidiosa archaeon]
MATREFDIELDKASVKRILTTSSGKGLDDTIDNVLETCMETAHPIAAYETSDIKVLDDDRLLIGGEEFTSNFLRRCLGQKEKVHPFVMTLGKKTDEALYGQSDVLSQYILDVLYNLVLVKMERGLRSQIGNEYSYAHISKLSPGSLDYWPLQQQLPLFNLLSEGIKQIDVELDKNCIMHPSKSISGIIFQTRIPFSSCIFCSMEGCPGREQPYQIEKSEYYLGKI